MKNYESQICEISQSGKEKDAICSESSSVSGISLTKKLEGQAVTMTYECQKKSKMTTKKISNRKNIHICMKQRLHTERKKL
jgi:hypothetical protein